MKNNNDIMPFYNYLKQITSKDLFYVFDDFLTICIYCFSYRRKEQEYLNIIKKYSTEEIDLLSQAYIALGYDADNNGIGFIDPFGDFFMDNFSSNSNGQFFTPECICDLMTDMAYIKNEDKTVYDPCCGSGRMFLSVAKRDPNRLKYYLGADISLTCCKMTLINMALNSMNGVIYWMNSISLEIFGKWSVSVNRYTKLPFIQKMDIDEKTDTEYKALFQKSEEQPIEYTVYS